MFRFGIVYLVVVVLISCVDAHFQLVDNASGGEIFDQWDNAGEITDITRSSSMNRVSLCGHLYLWLKFNRPDSKFDTLMVGASVPVIERFKDARVAVAVFGRGLPGMLATQDDVNEFCDRSPVGRLCRGYADLPDDLKTAHGEIQAQLGLADLGAIAVPGVTDQSNCDFGEDQLTLDVTGSMYVESSGGDDVSFATYHDWGGESHCFFHEEWAGSDMWIVQDKLISLAGEGEHYIVYWVPGDDSLGEPTQPAKFTAVFGDEGQSEDFDGETIKAGECSQPAQDFNEQDCHGYTRPLLPTLLQQALEIFFDPSFLTTSFIYLPWGGAPCVESYAATVPNVYTCGTAPPEKSCTGLCHNHGVCPAEPSLNDGVAFDVSRCTDETNELDFPLCGETCARDVCLDDTVADTKFGPVGPGCVYACEDDCFLFFFFCEEKCGMPSKECEGIYEEPHSED